jgi:hypothetical protein
MSSHYWPNQTSPLPPKNHHKKIEAMEKKHNTNKPSALSPNSRADSSFVTKNTNVLACLIKAQHISYFDSIKCKEFKKYHLSRWNGTNHNIKVGSHFPN